MIRHRQPQQLLMFTQTEEFDGTNFTNGGNLGAATYGGTAQWNSGDNDAATITAFEIAG